MRRLLPIFALLTWISLVHAQAPEQEPSYRGKPTSYWRAKLHKQMWTADGYPRQCGNKPLFGARDTAAIPVLLRLLRDEDGGIRATAVHSLSTMGRELDDIVPALIGVVPALVHALKDPEPLVRHYAAYALANVDPVKHETVPLLVAALKDEEICVRISAAEALGTIGPSAMAATGALARALKDEDDYVRVKSAGALYKIDRRKWGQTPKRP